MSKYFPKELNYIESEQNPGFKSSLKLLTSHGQNKQGAILLSGWRELSQALSLKCHLDCIYLDDSLEAYEFWLAHRSQLPDELIRIIPPKLYQRLAFTEQAMRPIAQMRVAESEFKPEFLAEAQRVLILDRVQDPGNVGSLIRTAAAFGFGLVILTKGSARLSNPKLWRAAAGSLAALKLCDSVEPEELIKTIKAEQLELLVADLAGSDPFSYLEEAEGLKSPKARALLLGNEGRGPAKEFKELASKILTLEITEGAESLNVAIAGGILMYLLR